LNEYGIRIEYTLQKNQARVVKQNLNEISTIYMTGHGMWIGTTSRKKITHGIWIVKTGKSRSEKRDEANPDREQNAKDLSLRHGL
jgi:hypothetical protein